MGWIRPGSHRSTPIKLLIVGLILIGARAYSVWGPDAVEFAIKGSLAKLLIQVPAGVVAALIASRLFEFDFGTIGTVALKIAGITVLAEGVGCWIPSLILEMLAEFVVMLIGFFWLFELSTWQTYLVLFLNYAVLFGAYHIRDNYLDSPRSLISRRHHVAGEHHR
jgi:hypothetical protein